MSSQLLSYYSIGLGRRAIQLAYSVSSRTIWHYKETLHKINTKGVKDEKASVTKLSSSHFQDLHARRELTFSLTSMRHPQYIN